MAAVDAMAQFLLGLRQARLLEPDQLERVSARAAGGDVLPEAVGKELVRREWLTAYQAERVLRGRADELAVGPYVVLDAIGEGGTGEVYKARHRALGRFAAVKVIRRELLARPNAVERFYREVEATARLEHAHIVTAYDAGPIGQTHFFAMEYVDGTNLSRLVAADGPVAAARACAFVRQAALALDYAHGQGMVHRDIKPSNLMLSARDGRIKLLDLGLVRFDRRADGDAPATLTDQGGFLGTPDFMAPEQAEDTHRVDHRADLYSLGATLYFLLGGRVLFPDCTLFQKLIRLQTTEPPPLHEVCPGLPPALTALVAKLLAKKAEARYQTAAAVVRALDAVPGGDGPPARPASSPARTAAADTSTGGRTQANDVPPPAPADAPPPELWRTLHEKEAARPKVPPKKPATRGKAGRPAKGPIRRRRPPEIPAWFFPLLGTLLVVLVFGIGGGVGFYLYYHHKVGAPKSPAAGPAK